GRPAPARRRGRRGRRLRRPAPPRRRDLRDEAPLCAPVAPRLRGRPAPRRARAGGGGGGRVSNAPPGHAACDGAGDRAVPGAGLHGDGAVLPQPGAGGAVPREVPSANAATRGKLLLTQIAAPNYSCASPGSSIGRRPAPAPVKDLL